jgi:hypothetical protein
MIFIGDKISASGAFSHPPVSVAKPHSRKFGGDGLQEEKKFTD